MKSLFSLNRALLMGSCLVWPGMALAQEASPVAPQAAEAQPVAEADMVDEPAESGEIVVRGRFIPEPMRQTSEVATFLSSADLERQGDDTAAAALTRLTGLSVVSGRFVFVRGLGDRYSSALLNGSPLPSPEPLRRTVPLDLFPSNILDGATVQKTFSPNYPGEFGGGVIDLQTLRQPNETFFNVKLGGSVNTETTFRDGLFYQGGDRDWTGYDDGIRDVPDALTTAIRNGNINTLDRAARDRIGESLVNSPLSVLQSGDIAPAFEAEVTAGTTIDYGRFNIGLVGVAGYDSSWRTERAIRQIQSSGQLGVDQEVTSTAWDVTVNALGSLSVGWDRNEVTFTSLYVHNTTKEAQAAVGFDFNAAATATDNAGVGIATDRNEAQEGTAWFERQLASFQLAGEHGFGGLDVEWRTAFAQSTRNAPYEYSVDRALANTGARLFGSQNNFVYRFSDLTDEVVSGGVDLDYTFNLTEQLEAVLSGGYAYSNTVRDYELLQFQIGGGRCLPPDARPDFCRGPDNIGPGRLSFTENTGPDDAYKGGLLVNAAYLAADVELTSFLRAALGARLEDGRQFVRTQNRLGAPTQPETRIEEEYILPAATLTWNFAEDLQLRVGYSQTIARPQLRELAVSQYTDPDTDRVYRGNPFLRDSELTNYDARLEYYFGRNQFVTGGLFYKQIDNPIEEFVFETSDFNFVNSFINAPEATVQGLELEYRTNFEMPVEGGWFADKDWFFAANYTYTDAQIEADPNTRLRTPLSSTGFAQFGGLDGSQLQGTPENIVNAQFGYETLNSQLTLLLGWVDERLLQRGNAGTPDVLEDPGVNLDLVYRRDFTLGGSDFTFGLSGRNLLGEDHEEFQTARGPLVDAQSNTPIGGRTDFNTFDRGTTFSASITAKF